MVCNTEKYIANAIGTAVGKSCPHESMFKAWHGAWHAVVTKVFVKINPFLLTYVDIHRPMRVREPKIGAQVSSRCGQSTQIISGASGMLPRPERATGNLLWR